MVETMKGLEQMCQAMKLFDGKEFKAAMAILDYIATLEAQLPASTATGKAANDNNDRAEAT